MKSVCVPLLGALLLSSGAASYDVAWSQSDYTGGNVTVLEGKMEFHWRTIDASASTLHFALVAPFSGKGWVGFGIGEPTSGSMPGADMVIIQYDAGAMTTPIVGDYFADSFDTPQLDCEGKDEWTLVKTTSSSTTVVYELTRALNASGTSYDRDLSLGMKANKFVFAYGTKSSIMSYHGSSRAVASANLVPARSAGSPSVVMRDVAATVKSSFTTNWTMKDYIIPAVETTYVNSPCVEAPPTNSSGFEPYLIGTSSFATPGNERYVHHMVAQGYTNSDCSGRAVGFGGAASKHGIFMFPEDVGLALRTFKSFNVQLHYDNPDNIALVRDSSGMTAYYTYEPTLHEAGILQLADPIVSTPYDIPEGLSSYHYSCPHGCLSSWTASKVTVFAQFFHMHKVGYRMNMSQYASDGSLVRATTSDYYQFSMQERDYVEPYYVHNTDRLDTTCSYKVPKGTGEIEFGLDSDEEMCINFLMYYPYQSVFTGSYCGVLLCGGLPDTHPVESEWDFPKSFGAACAGRPDNETSTSSGTAKASSVLVFLSLVGFAMTMM